MKRLIKWLLAIVFLVIILALLITPYFIGQRVDGLVAKSVKQINHKLAYQALTVKDKQRHWWSTQVKITIHNPDEMQSASNGKEKLGNMDLTIHHGPFAIASSKLLPHSVYFGYASVTGQVHIKKPSGPEQYDTVKMKGFDKPIKVGALLSWTKTLRVFAKSPAYQASAQNNVVHLGSISLQGKLPLAEVDSQSADKATNSKWGIKLAESYIDLDSQALNTGYPTHVKIDQATWKRGFHGKPSKDWSSVGKFVIPKMTIKLKNLTQIQINELSVLSRANANSGKIDVKQRMKIKHLKALGAQIKPLLLKWSWHNIHEQPWLELKTILNKQENESYQDITHNTGRMITKAAQAFSNTQGQFKLKGNTPLGWIKLHGKTSLNWQDIQGPQDVRNKISARHVKLNSQLTLPKSFLSSRKVRQDPLTQIMHSGVKQAYQLGLLNKQDDQLVANLFIKQGQTRLNGKPLQQFLSKQSSIERGQQPDLSNSHNHTYKQSLST